MLTWTVRDLRDSKIYQYYKYIFLLYIKWKKPLKLHLELQFYHTLTEAEALIITNFPTG